MGKNSTKPTIADLLQFFDGLMADTAEELLKIRHNSAEYRHKAKRLTKGQRRSLRKFITAIKSPAQIDEIISAIDALDF